jgi:hypothetical protein
VCCPLSAPLGCRSPTPFGSCSRTRRLRGCIAPGEPQRHRDTERAQSQPPTSQPRRLKDTKETQSPLDYRRGTGRQMTAGLLGRSASPNASVRCSVSTQQPALSESAGLASRTFCDGVGLKRRRSSRHDHGGTDAPCASAGGKSDRDGCLHPERSGFSPGAGDHRIAGVAAAPLRATSSPQVSHLCVLRVFVVATILRSVCSVPLWFARCGGSAMVADEDQGFRDEVDSPLE